ncbi:hypothetical protein JRO89_XSUnG0151000 [Xanthoceras sorbifolium]|uniref:Uncharacterized protein n=1 Tax=Xanthoceras sorbifolium TaxID=99658 RepID=A0ABQ8GXY1_9ROSI|nr:hypothetical protein JRO89_XSUnG0151000 [Xanthoceras sorbifolium]
MDVEVISREIIKPTSTSPHDHYKFSDNGGVLVLEAQVVNCQLSEIVQNPNPDKFVAKFLPYDVNNLVLAIQVNYFNCGGIAIGVRMSHKVADGSSITTFIKNWAKTARDNIENVCPKIVGTTLFPPKDGVDGKSDLPPEGNLFPLCLYLLILNYLLSKKNTLLHQAQQKVAGHIHRIVDPQLADDSFGNIIGAAIISIDSSENDIKVEEGSYDHGLVNKLTRAISKINKDSMKKVQDGKLDGLLVWEGVDENTWKREVVNFVCTSFCRFPIYEADFGWGRPAWVSSGDIAWQEYTTILMDTKNGNGIEAWVYLTEEDMAKFERDKELLTYASPTT